MLHIQNFYWWNWGSIFFLNWRKRF